MVKKTLKIALGLPMLFIISFLLISSAMAYQSSTVVNETVSSLNGTYQPNVTPPPNLEKFADIESLSGEITVQNEVEADLPLNTDEIITPLLVATDNEISTYQNIPYQLFYPSTGTNFPLIIMASGIAGDYKFINDTAASIATYGFATLAFTTNASMIQNIATQYIPQCRANLNYLISFALNEAAFPITINESRIGVWGFSGGGASVLGLDNSYVRVIVAQCPYYVAGVSSVNDVPVLIVSGSIDGTAPYSHGLSYYNEMQSGRLLVDISGMNHDAYNANAEVYEVAWFDYFLNGNETAKATLTEDTVIADAFVLQYQYDVILGGSPVDLYVIQPSLNGTRSVNGVPKNSVSKINGIPVS